MRLRWQMPVVFVAGFLVGATGGLAIGTRHARWLQRLHQTIQVTEMALDGQEIVRGRADRVERRIADGLPAFAAQLVDRLPEAEAATTLWTVRHYYERAKRTPPPDLAKALATLPVEYEALCPKPQPAAEAEPSL